MSRRAASIVIAAALTGLLFASVTTSDGVDLWGAPRWDPAPIEIDPIDIDPTREEVGTSEPSEQTTPSPVELPDWITAILRVLLVTAAIVALITMFVGAWHRRPRLRWRPPAIGDDDFDVLPDVAAAVVDEAAEQRAALLGGAPRNAIVRCWLRLERDVAAAGLPRRPSDTSAEFTERVLARYSVDSEAIRELAALYREARFSVHPIDETARRAALDALDRLHRALVDPADGPDLATDPATGGSR